MNARHRTTGPSAAWPIAGLALIALVAGAISVSATDTSHSAEANNALNTGVQVPSSRGAGALPPGLHDPGTPCSTATMLDLQALPGLRDGESLVDVSSEKSPIVLPDPGVAVPTRAWSCGTSAQAPVVMFGSVQVIYDTTLTAKDHLAYLRNLVSDAQESAAPVAQLGQLSGAAVAQIKGSADSDRSALAMFVGDTFVVLESMRADDIEEMTRLASSILEHG
jgi:hypothetical protein